MKIAKLPTAKKAVIEQLENCINEAKEQQWDDVVVIFTTKDGDYGAWQTLMPCEKAHYMAALYCQQVMNGEV